MNELKIGMETAVELGWDVSSASNKDIRALGKAIVEAENRDSVGRDRPNTVYGNFAVNIESQCIYFRQGKGYVYDDGLCIENGKLQYYLTIPSGMDKEEFIEQIKSNGGFI